MLIFKVAMIREDVHLIDLKWTAQGDNETEETAKEFELRVNKTRGQLIGENNFVNQTRVTANIVVLGELKPLIAGSK